MQRPQCAGNDPPIKISVNVPQNSWSCMMNTANHPPVPEKSVWWQLWNMLHVTLWSWPYFHSSQSVLCFWYWWERGHCSIVTPLVPEGALSGSTVSLEKPGQFQSIFWCPRQTKRWPFPPAESCLQAAIEYSSDCNALLPEMTWLHCMRWVFLLLFLSSP